MEGGGENPKKSSNFKISAKIEVGQDSTGASENQEKNKKNHMGVARRLSENAEISKISKQGKEMIADKVNEET